MTITRAARTAGVAAGIAATALALTACHPPNQQDSETGKVDTATSFAAATSVAASTDQDASQSAATTTGSAAKRPQGGEGTPLYQSCMDEPAREPDIIALSCQTMTNNVEHIEWDSWGPEEASGTGVHVDNGSEHQVTIQLTNVEEAPFGPTFSTVIVDGTPVDIL